MKIDILRRCVAECVGTFALVFIGCTTRAMIGDTTDFAGILVVHLAFAFTIAAMIYTLSRSHFWLCYFRTISLALCSSLLASSICWCCVGCRP